MGSSLESVQWMAFGGAEATQIGLAAALLIGLLVVVWIAARRVARVVGLKPLGAQQQASQNTELEPGSTHTGAKWVLGTLVVSVAWLAITGFVAGSGLLGNYDAVPPPMLRIVLPGILLVGVAAFTGLGARLAGGLGWGVLIGFQVFRIPTELMLDSLYQSGRLPVQMTFHGANFDILTGISALFIAWLASRGRIGLRGILVWNIAGLLLLANIVALAVLSMPGRLRLFMNEPANTLVFGWPFVWLPAWLVLMALFGHLLVFRKAWLMRRASANATAMTPIHPVRA